MAPRDTRVNDNLLIRYALGELSETEESQIEERYFSSEEFFEELRAVEDELIDAYVLGELSPARKESFERRFINTPEGLKRIRLARTWMRMTAGEPAESASRGRLAALIDSFSFGRARLAMAGAAAALVIGIGWLLVETQRLRGQLSEIQTIQMELERSAQVLRAEIDSQRARNQELSKKLEEERSAKDASSSAPAWLSLVLTPGLLRGGGSGHQVNLPPGESTLRLELRFESDSMHPTYRAQVRTPEGREVLTLDGLRARSTPSGKSVSLTLAGRTLQRGDYLVSLRGKLASGEFEDIADYIFTVELR